MSHQQPDQNFDIRREPEVWINGYLRSIYKLLQHLSALHHKCAFMAQRGIKALCASKVFVYNLTFQLYILLLYTIYIILYELAFWIRDVMCMR